jgi:sigma-B regulation protein RsbU (phosphoserine phosphatase)
VHDRVWVVAMLTRRTPLPGEPRSPGLARALVREIVAECGLEAIADEAALLTTELATNAVRHAGTAMHVEVSADASGITVRVTDGSRAMLGLQLTTSALSEDGRGLQLVDALATTWGVDYGSHGKSVWFRIDVVAGQPRSASAGWAVRPAVSGGTAGAVVLPLPAGRSRTPRPTEVTLPEQPAHVVAARSDRSDTVGAASWLTYLPDRLVHELEAPELAEEVLHRACDVTGAPFGALWVDEGGGGGNLMLAVVGLSPSAADPPPVLWPDDAPRPRRAAFGAPTPAMVAAGAEMSLSVAVPATPPTRARLELAGRAGYSFGSADPVFALLAAERIAVSLDSARVRDTDQRRRGDLAFLADASELLASSLDVDLTLALVAQLCVPRLGQWCVIHTFDDADDPELIVAVHTDERQVPDLENAFLDKAGAALRDRIRAARVTRAAAPLTAPASGLILPLTVRSEVLGTMTIGDPPERRHNAEEMAIGVDLARRAALSVDNARLYSERDAAAQALQNALLPASLPVADGVEFAAEYRPTGEGNDVGGDFYDVLPLGTGHWLVAIGDVCGKGPAAASVTGMVRDVLRVLAREGRPLPYSLAALNVALLEQTGEGTFCTVAAADVVRTEKGLTVRLCLAGHPPPALITASGASFVGTGGMAAGLAADIEVDEVEIGLDPGDTLVFFTDGVTERRRGDRLFGEDSTLATLAGCGGLPAAEVAARLRAAATEFGIGPLRDDLAILALRATD